MTFVGASLVDAAIIFLAQIRHWNFVDFNYWQSCYGELCVCVCMFVNVNGLSIVILHPEYMSNVKGFTSLIDWFEFFKISIIVVNDSPRSPPLQTTVNSYSEN